MEFIKSKQEKTERSAPKKRDPKKKPAQPKESDDHARRNTKVKEGATEEECVAGPVVTRAQAKKSDKVHLLKLKEGMSSVDKSTNENLQKKDSTLKKCFDRIGKPVIRENYVGEFSIQWTSRGKEDRSQNTPELLLARTMPGRHQVLSFLRCMPENRQEGVVSRRYH